MQVAKFNKRAGVNTPVFRLRLLEGIEKRERYVVIQKKANGELQYKLINKIDLNRFNSVRWHLSDENGWQVESIIAKYADEPLPPEPDKQELF